MAIGSPLHLEARRYAEDGIPVFPCVVGGKEPACENGFKDATTDLEQLDAWWSEADYNIGIEPERAGWGVVDVDPGGLETWDRLCAEHRDWHSTRVRTPRGGLHVYYVGSLPPTVGTEKSGIAAGIDTRGRGSYVLVPPSVVNGVEYKWEGDDETAPLPEWIAEACKRKSVEVTAAVVELDLPANLQRADEFLKRLPEVAEGTRNATAFTTACKLRELGLSPDATYERMVEWNDTHCNPPIDETELALTVGSACKNAQNAAGAFGVTTAADAFGATLSKLASDAPSSSSPPRFYVYSENEQDVMEEPTWLIPDLLPDASTVMWYGETGSYKSFLALDVALGLAFGVSTFGYSPPEACEVVYIAGEGPRSISRRRRPAWKIAREVSGRGKFGLVCNMPLARDPTLIQEAIDQIKGQGLQPRLVVLDTAATAMSGMNENDFKDTSSFLECAAAFKNAFGCTVLIVHHASEKSTTGLYRGSSALKAGIDAAFKITATRATRAVAVQCEKMKDAEERAEPWTFEGKQIGPSLVFFPTTLAEHSQLTVSQDAYAKQKIGQALLELQAEGRDKAVTTNVLATHLFAPDPNASPSDQQATLSKACKTLNALARNKLQAYCVIEGAQRWWMLPDAGNVSAGIPDEPAVI